MIERSARVAIRVLLIASIGASLGAAPACSSSKSQDISAAVAAPDGGGHDTGAPPTPKIPECKNGKPLLLLDRTDTGYVMCDGYSSHRPVVKACVSKVPRDIPCGTGSLGGCTKDAECTTKPFGYCHAGGGSSACFCEYGCNADADCGQGQVCICGDVTGQCQKATCTSDADCNGLLCLETNDTACGKIFACQTAKDTCASPIDCRAPFDDCQYVGDHRECRASKLCP